MNTMRLQHLIEVLEKVRDNNKPFNMLSWVDNWRTAENCNTAACAAGWACRDEQFKEQGLRLAGGAEPVYERYYGFAAVREFFAISRAASYWLFDPDEYDGKYSGDITVNQVIRRVEAVIAGHLDGVEELP